MRKIPGQPRPWCGSYKCSSTTFNLINRHCCWGLSQISINNKISLKNKYYMFLFLRLKVFGQCFDWYMLDLFLLWHVTVGCALKQDHTKAVWFSKSVVTFHQLRCAGWPSAHSSTTWIAPVVGFSEVFYITFGAGCEVAETQLTGSKIIKPCYPFPFMYLDCQLQDQSP